MGNVFWLYKNENVIWNFKKCWCCTENWTTFFILLEIFFQTAWYYNLMHKCYFNYSWLMFLNTSLLVPILEINRYNYNNYTFMREPCEKITYSFFFSSSERTENNNKTRSWRAAPLHSIFSLSLFLNIFVYVCNNRISVERNICAYARIYSENMWITDCSIKKIK